MPRPGSRRSSSAALVAMALLAAVTLVVAGYVLRPTEVADVSAIRLQAEPSPSAEPPQRDAQGGDARNGGRRQVRTGQRRSPSAGDTADTEQAAAPPRNPRSAPAPAPRPADDDDDRDDGEDQDDGDDEDDDDEDDGGDDD